ncbi:MAG: site-2 protease family protein [Candidatus Margulisiibacteriota bacterium]
MGFLLIALILLYSIILHEIAHGKAAELMGDPTARLGGRLTLNPIPHIDPFGTILPIILVVIGSPIIFGWAKPVPINPYNFSNYRRGMIWVSAAGILTNLFLAWILATVLKVMPDNGSSLVYLLKEVLNYGVHINIVLAIFNLIPIPPLDGSKLAAMFLPYEQAAAIERLEPYGMIILFFILTFPLTQTLLWSIVDLIYNLMMMKFF